MKKIKIYFNILFVMLIGITFITCADNLNLSIIDNEDVNKNGIVRIYIGENTTSARTVYPASDSIAGYQLIFSGSEVKVPVNITEGNSVDVFLANGTWIITATAYKLGGTIGNIDDAIASGSIIIRLSNGVVSGTVPPIILSQSGSSGDGILNYNITFDSNISGIIKLWHIDGDIVNSFGNNGELSLNNSVDVDFNLVAGRYIAEIKLVNEEGNIAFYREVIEIWKDTKTILIFTPTVFYDPSMTPQNYGDFNVISNNHSMIFYTEGVLNITDNGSYIISMKEGITTTFTDRIKVATGVEAEITLSNVNIDIQKHSPFAITDANVSLTLIGENNLLISGGTAGFGAGIEVPSGSTLSITKESSGSLTARGGYGRGAGIGSAALNWYDDGGAFGGNSGIINITGGTVIAYGGGEGGAGIGGAFGGNGGIINITGGTVIARGGRDGGAGIGGGRGGDGGVINITGGTISVTIHDYFLRNNTGAGIGGGSGGAGGTIKITGGTITASSDLGAGIGGGKDGASGTITEISGNAVIFASSFSSFAIQPDLSSGTEFGNAIVFNGIDGNMYGSVSLDRNITIPSDRILSIANGQTLVVQNGYTLTNNGAIIIENGGSYAGLITGNQPVVPSFIISGNSAYTYQGGILNIRGNGTYNIGMRNGVSSTSAERIVVSSGVIANITLSNVNIDFSSMNETNWWDLIQVCAFDMTGATVNLTLVGDNVLRSGFSKAGIRVPDGATLIITEASTGSLTTSSGDYHDYQLEYGLVPYGGGAGIGGTEYESGGNITIKGGIIFATGSNGGAGIGGASRGAGGTISITGGTVTAKGHNGGAADIGGGYRGAGGMITEISGNAVIFASSIQPDLPTGSNMGPAIVFIGNNGVMYGNVTLQQNVTFTSGRILNISSGQILTIPSGRTLTNNGTINNSGMIYRYGVIDGSGSVVGNQPMQ